MTRSIRSFWVILHRWFGLAMAAFLFMAGLTGAVISWDHELDALLNPHLMFVESQGPALSGLELAERVEAADPRAVASYIPLAAEAGHALDIFVEGRIDPTTHEPYLLDYNQVFLDPVTGEILGKRMWGAITLDREHLMPFLYAFHYTLCMPEMWGIHEWGVWLMGGVALIWTIDCFIGFYLTLPVRSGPVRGGGRQSWWQRWKPAWQIKQGASTYRLNLDIHRAFGLWTWVLLFILAISATSLNLYSEVAKPLVNLFSSFTPTPFDLRTPNDHDDPIVPALGWAEIVARAEAERPAQGWTEPVGAIGYSAEYGVYYVGFFAPGDDHGAAGVGPVWAYFDGMDGRYLSAAVPWTGTAGDLFLQIQFPLHSGRIIGLPGRILISVMGLVVAALSVTGVVVWWKKRSSRRLAEARRGAATEPLARQGKLPA